MLPRVFTDKETQARGESACISDITYDDMVDVAAMTSNDQVTKTRRRRRRRQTVRKWREMNQTEQSGIEDRRGNLTVRRKRKEKKATSVLERGKKEKGSEKKGKRGDLNNAFSAPRICTVDAGYLARLVRLPAWEMSRAPTFE